MLTKNKVGASIIILPSPVRPNAATGARAILLLITVCAAVYTFAPSAHAEENSTAREQLEAMNAEEREELRRKVERFENLTSEEQQRLRDLESQIAADPDAEDLRQVMARYYEWLKTLSSRERTELGELPPADRLKRIKEIRESQKLAAETKGADALTGNDWFPIWRRIGEVAWRDRDTIIAAAPPHRRAMLKIPHKDDKHARGALIGEMFTQAKETNKPLPITEEDFAELEEDLSPPAREALAATTTLDEKLQLLRAWLERGRRSGPSDWRERVQKFFDQLPEEEKQRLLAIPDEHERRREMFDMYWKAQGKEPPGHGRHGRGDGPRHRDRRNRGGRPDFDSRGRDGTDQPQRLRPSRPNDDADKAAGDQSSQK